MEFLGPAVRVRLDAESRAQTILHLRIAAEQAELLLSASLDDREDTRAGIHAMTPAALLDSSAQAIAKAIKTGAASAREIAREALARVEARNGALSVLPT